MYPCHTSELSHQQMQRAPRNPRPRPGTHTASRVSPGWVSGGRVRAGTMPCLRDANEPPSCAGKKQTCQAIWGGRKALGAGRLVLLPAPADAACSRTPERPWPPTARQGALRRVSPCSLLGPPPRARGRPCARVHPQARPRGGGPPTAPAESTWAREAPETPDDTASFAFDPNSARPALTSLGAWLGREPFECKLGELNAWGAGGGGGSLPLAAARASPSLPGKALTRPPRAVGFRRSARAWS